MILSYKDWDFSFFNVGNACKCDTFSYMMCKNVFINQDINFANCEKPDLKQTLPSTEFDSNNEHLVLFVRGLQRISICMERLRKNVGV
jgi:hypothetical protein